MRYVSTYLTLRLERRCEDRGPRERPSCRRTQTRVIVVQRSAFSERGPRPREPGRGTGPRRAVAEAPAGAAVTHTHRLNRDARCSTTNTVDALPLPATAQCALRSASSLLAGVHVSHGRDAARRTDVGPRADSPLYSRTPRLHESHTSSAPASTACCLAPPWASSTRSSRAQKIILQAR